MRGLYSLGALAGFITTASAARPMLTGEIPVGSVANPHHHGKRDNSNSNASSETEAFLSEFYLNDNNSYLTTDVGGPIGDQNSLKAGIRGSTLLEDFIFRQKIQHFDHERVPERAVHARGAGAHGVFTSYADWSNITAASFLGAAGKETPTFVRFSTVAGSRGSADTARDVHGFATRLYTDEGNYDIVGNNIPVFFIQDAILFPDLIHSVKPQPANEIPQAATAHDTAYDFFGQQPSTLHTLFWAMAGHGIPRSFRHIDGFGVHTYRFVTNDGSSKLVKFHWTSLQGRASLVWEEAQAVSGKNADYMRQDLYNSIEAGRYPEWELGVQIIDESDVLSYGFDLLDPTKILPVEDVPITPLGKLQLNRNPLNYFAETEQVMFQPGHIVRGIDFTEDPLLQGRIFSYLDTQLNRNGGPNFEQIPINRPRVPIHNNNRDGAGQIFIPLNTAAYSPNTLNGGSPKQANETVGNGFFTSPGRSTDGHLVRATSPTFADVWSQPGLFYNSLTAAEQQFVINALRFELSLVGNGDVKSTFITQINRVNNTLATLVASAIGISAPEPDPKYYHSNKTSNVGTFGTALKKIDGLKVGVLASVNNESSIAEGQALARSLAGSNVDVVIVAEHLTSNVSATYSGSDATNFDAVIVGSGAEGLFGPQTFTAGSNTTLYPAGRPSQILVDAFRFGKPVGAVGGASAALSAVDISTDRSGVVTGDSVSDDFVKQLTEDLATFRFLDRFAVDK